MDVAFRLAGLLLLLVNSVTSNDEFNTSGDGGGIIGAGGIGGGVAYQISPKPCQVKGLQGRCMFVWECIKTEGTPLGMCMERFMFGSCCAHDIDNNLLPSGTSLLTSSLSLPLSMEIPNHLETNVVPTALDHEFVELVTTSTTPATTSTTASTTLSTTVSTTTTTEWSTTGGSTLGMSTTARPTTTKTPSTTTVPSTWKWTASSTSTPPTTTPTTSTTSTTPLTTTSTTPPTTTSTTSHPPTTTSTTSHPPTTSSTTSHPPTTTSTTSHSPITTVSTTASTSTASSTVQSTTTSSSSNSTSLTIELSVEDATEIPTVAVTSLPTTHKQSECGVAPLIQQHEGRIVGGTTSKFGAWPWQVSVRRTSFFGFSSTHRCGGALLNELWVITAGHCVEDLLVSQIRLRLGEYDFSNAKEPFAYVERAASKKIVHPKYNFFTYEYDLALVRLEEAIDFQPNIAPICLPATENVNLVGMNATVTGWGRLSEGGTLPSKLQQVTLPIVSNQKCEAMFLKAGRKEHIPDIFMCAGYEEGGRDSCQGDSGGPMQIQGKDGKYFLGGIISWGIGCAEANLPGVCTRISKFTSWILENVT